MIYERLDLQHPVNKELREVTRQHMESFGAGGLRTLCLSYAELPHEEYDRYMAASTLPAWAGCCWKADGHLVLPGLGGMRW